MSFLNPNTVGIDKITPQKFDRECNNTFNFPLENKEEI
jgi:hypothetical protein